MSLHGAVFGVGSGPIHMNYLICNGTEYKLVDCGYQNNTDQHNEDWSVTCKNGNCCNFDYYGSNAELNNYYR